MEKRICGKSEVCFIHMKNVKLSINDRLPKATNFNNGANVILEHSRMVVPWAATGAMAGAYESAIKYVSERKQFRSPLSAFQINQEKLVRALGYFQAAFLD